MTKIHSYDSTKTNFNIVVSDGANWKEMCVFQSSSTLKEVLGFDFHRICPRNALWNRELAVAAPTGPSGHKDTIVPNLGFRLVETKSLFSSFNLNPAVADRLKRQ